MVGFRGSSRKVGKSLRTSYGMSRLDEKQQPPMITIFSSTFKLRFNKVNVVIKVILFSVIFGLNLV